MNKPYFENQRFEKVDFSEHPPEMGEYEKCSFLHCNFSNTDLSGLSFSDCVFTDCNLSLVKLVKTSFRENTLLRCKVLGVHFYSCNPFLFSARFEDCLLNLSSFYKLGLKKMLFKACSLQEVDFTEADLTAALFDTCDLSRATFDGSILEKADLRSSYNFSIDPEKNKLKKARFSLQGLPGLLHKYNITIDEI